VFVDDAQTRARIDTSADDSYWMRRIDSGWRIVAFGSLTERSLRAFGGRWTRDPFPRA
jgi:hypothetical protein